MEVKKAACRGAHQQWHVAGTNMTGTAAAAGVIMHPPVWLVLSHTDAACLQLLQLLQLQQALAAAVDALAHVQARERPQCRQCADVWARVCWGTTRSCGTCDVQALQGAQLGDA